MRSYTFLDNGYPPGPSFRQALLTSHAFDKTMLADLLPPDVRKGLYSKAELVLAVDHAVTQGTVDSAQVVSKFVTAGCRYLALRKIIDEVPEFKRAGEFGGLLDSFGESGWHGPILAPAPHGGIETLYVYTAGVEHWVAKGVGEGHSRLFYRWTMTARFHEGAVSFHWQNFTRNVLVKSVTKNEQFKYWEYVDQAIDALGVLVGVTFHRVDLYKLVYDTLWTKFDGAPGYKWVHLGINADREGVVLSADSSVKMGMQGLQNLTTTIARMVIHNSQHKAVIAHEETWFDKVILHTLLKEWGTNSYGFQLEKGAGAATIAVLHARFYMASKLKKSFKPSQMVNSLAHILCYMGEGGSIPAARFLVPHL